MKLKKKFTQRIDMRRVHNSMILDSETEIARLEWGELVATLEIRGSVKVYYKGACYKNASRMPNELLEMLNNWKEEYSAEVQVDMNNWPEVFLWTKDNDKLIWTGYSDVADAEGMTRRQIRKMLDEYITECINEYGLVNPATSNA